MGDAADALIEDGQNEWWAHQHGECEYGCPYCAEEEKKRMVAYAARVRTRNVQCRDGRE